MTQLTRGSAESSAYSENTSQHYQQDPPPAITQAEYHLARDKQNIRRDAQQLMDCAHQVCENHLYHSDIKQAFIDDVGSFAKNIVNQVDTGAISYQTGSEKIKQQEKSLWEQSMEWASRGLSVLGGTGLIMAGVAMCTTGVGCIIGAYVAAHGVSGIYEGLSGREGFLRSSYRAGAKQLGMSESVGDLAYDLVDAGISVHGKLKLIPKINDSYKINKFNTHNSEVFKLFHYGRQDLVRAYKQMGAWLLRAEVIGDVNSLYTIIKDANNTVIFNKKTQETSIIITKPEKIIDTDKLFGDCEYVMLVTGDKNPGDSDYYLCTNPEGEYYKTHNPFE